MRPVNIRFFLIAAVLLLGVLWAFASAAPIEAPTYPNGRFLITADRLKERLRTEPIVVIDVRGEEHFDGKMIPGAIRLPWTAFRRESAVTNMGGLFVGPAEAQKILGRHGIFRNDMVVLYDSVERDGGATASYLFWVFDMLGHEKIALLERGIDGWIDAGGKVVNEPEQREPLLYQAPADEIRLRRWADGAFILSRLGDPYYQILDVRSQEEYLGEKLNTGLDGSALKAGHIPGAVNIDYRNNWIDPETKAIKRYGELLQLYRGLDPQRAVITYCHSARRSSFGYFILRLMGFEDVLLYDNSWFEWGSPSRYYPVATEAVSPGSDAMPTVEKNRESASASSKGRKIERAPEPTKPAAEGKKGYISCGG